MRAGERGTRSYDRGPDREQRVREAHRQSSETMNCNGGSSVAGEACNAGASVDCRPIVTCAGDENLFSSLKKNLLESIPTDTVEWRRSFHRPVKQVKLGATFVSFCRDILPTDKDWHLIKQPIFHIYWTECPDVDTYKTSVRDDIDAWLKILNLYHIQDWMIVLVETYDVKKANKLLPRTTVLDKIRSDFAAKNGDRCFAVINPIKSESRSAESWRGLITRIRHLMLTAYDRTLSRFEDIIREQRERRNNPSWNFCHYFLLQEELAFALQMLGLYDEALVQYDELDALFTQFVLNSNVGDTPGWLGLFQTPLNNWEGVNLNNGTNHRLRFLLAECRASLLDLRSYLFSRQCAMLLLLNKPWEVAQRCLSFVHNTLSELRILEVQKPEGSTECWSFLCALEVLQACQLSTNNIDNNQQLDLCSLHTASLWALARDKLGSLGKLCGLMPGNEPTSEQLHTVVYLIAGIGDSEPQVERKLTPTDKLKEALSSKEAFKKQYLEHAELAMGTYKHVGRIRSARLIGKELARFYSELGENQKAVAFLSDALKTYMDEGWHHLAVQTQLELAECYKRMDDVEKYTKVCAAVASASLLHITVRNTYLEEMLGYMKMISSPQPLLAELGCAFTILSMEAKVMDKIVQDCVVNVEISVQSLFPREVRCTSAAISVEEIQKPSILNKKKGLKSSIDPPIQLLSKCTLEDMKLLDLSLLRLQVYSYLDWKEDRTLGSASVISKNMKPLVRRSDSAKHRKPSINIKGDFSKALSCDEFVMKPGVNTFVLTRRVNQPGLYKVSQLSLVIEEKLEFLSSLLNPRLCYEVAKTQPMISVNCGRDLLAGLTQDIELVISSGSTKITEEMKLKLRTSRGLTVQSQSVEKVMVKELEIPLPTCEPFQTIKIQLQILAELPPKKDASSMEHKLNIQCPWGLEESIPLHFGPPLMSSMKLHTAKQRKFIQIIVTGLTSQLLQLTEPELMTISSIDVNFKTLNPVAGQKLVIGNGMNVSFMWELEIGKDEKSTIPIKTDFRVKYISVNDTEELNDTHVDDDPLHIHNLERIEKACSVYRCNFDITDYVTLFTVSSKVETSGGEFCRAGSMCHLCLTVIRMPSLSSNPPPQLMYEVLADQTMWAVCGRTAGIVSLEIVEKQSVTLDVMPLTSGYLPLPVVRLSRYIPATESKNDIVRNKNDLGSGPRLEPFSPGQVYNASKAQQVHVLPAAPSESN
ncbi:PREDICTED: trafficking protein particle complex subunit 10 [Cyphomyrmex costatus]|uniref:trafficking protein particle complex subunit 10 n=1 Tax=Cyphomyrmex costatus TaxID=456900 RepID=UPI00085235B1|nr:PREDICTED: trafficking protein particle complex subunit 10 [Cyphomyrmex costatus]